MRSFAALATLATTGLLLYAWKRDPELVLIGVLTSAALAGQSVSALPGAVLRALGHMRADSIGTLAGRALLVLSAAAMLLAGGGVRSFAAAHVLGGLLAALAATAISARFSGWPRARGWRRRAAPLIAGGWPFAATALLVTIYFRVDVLMLGALSSERSVGLYAGAANLVYPAMMFSQAIVLSVFPIVAAARGLEDRSLTPVLRRAFGASIAIALPAVVAVAWLGADILGVVFGAPYPEASRAFAILMATLPLLYMTNLLGHVLGACGRQRAVVWVALANAAVNVALNLLLIPRFDYDGAAIATLLTEFLGLACLCLVLRRHLGPWLDARLIAGIVTATATLAAALWATDGWPLIARGALGALAYAGAALGLGVRRRLRGPWDARAHEHGAGGPGGNPAADSTEGAP